MSESFPPTAEVVWDGGGGEMEATCEVMFNWGNNKNELSVIYRWQFCHCLVGCVVAKEFSGNSFRGWTRKSAVLCLEHLRWCKYVRVCVCVCVRMRQCACAMYACVWPCTCKNKDHFDCTVMSMISPFNESLTFTPHRIHCPCIGTVYIENELHTFTQHRILCPWIVIVYIGRWACVSCWIMHLTLYLGLWL